jgi:hypothetical protein
LRLGHYYRTSYSCTVDFYHRLQGPLQPHFSDIQNPYLNIKDNFPTIAAVRFHSLGPRACTREVFIHSPPLIPQYQQPICCIFKICFVIAMSQSTHRDEVVIFLFDKYTTIFLITKLFYYSLTTPPSLSADFSVKNR